MAPITQKQVVEHDIRINFLKVSSIFYNLS